MNRLVIVEAPTGGEVAVWRDGDAAVLYLQYFLFVEMEMGDGSVHALVGTRSVETTAVSAMPR